MCQRKIFIHHRCSHKITELVEQCGSVECRTVTDVGVITNKYPCAVLESSVGIADFAFQARDGSA
ncbi:hypothetical protein B0T26DRAFT_753037 [Lasiosphaeria miniovina]|uniref:Uncharacterized protein n=1 Tax=Lasiosphaeria miniovina TaxID=1954250 RepID=A0AA40ABI0_9PEZI|nr:uncharacterized protein B0T26DRAFT_753037 [Lasiosphaeria miniovina]KAK0712857.1 hypothetical protein B0T26DRAFT_753037 [Lasiosphaeria miniovina]